MLSEVQHTLKTFAEIEYPTKEQATTLLHQVDGSSLLKALRDTTDYNEVELYLRVLDQLARFPSVYTQILLQVREVIELLHVAPKVADERVRQFAVDHAFRILTMKADELGEVAETLRKTALMAGCTFLTDYSMSVAIQAQNVVSKALETHDTSALETIVEYMAASPDFNCWKKSLKPVDAIVLVAQASPTAFEALEKKGLLNTLLEALRHETSDVLLMLVLLEYLSRLTRTEYGVRWLAQQQGIPFFRTTTVEGRGVFSHFPILENDVSRDSGVLQIAENIMEFASNGIASEGFAREGLHFIQSAMNFSVDYNEVSRLSALRLFSGYLRATPAEFQKFHAELKSIFIRVCDVASTLECSVTLRNLALEVLLNAVKENGRSQRLAVYRDPIKTVLFPKLAAISKREGPHFTESRLLVFQLLEALFSVMTWTVDQALQDEEFCIALTEESLELDNTALQAKRRTAKAFATQLNLQQAVARLGTHYPRLIDNFILGRKDNSPQITTDAS